MVPLEMVLAKYKVGDKVKMIYSRYDNIKQVEATLKSEKRYDLSFLEKSLMTDNMIQNQALWLHAK